MGGGGGGGVGGGDLGGGVGGSRSVNFKDIYHFSRFQRGSNIFQGGPTFSRRGVQLLILYRNPYNL